MQYLLIAILSVVLLAAIVSFAVMGFLQHRRSVALERWAAGLGLRYSAEDTFDLSRRHAAFAIIGGGHSPCAHNVTYGHVGESTLRAFDFHYEVGHGTRRMTRRYSVVLMGVMSAGPLLMWRQTDFAPLAAGQADGELGAWMYIGDRELAANLSDACPSLGQPGSCIQILDSTVLFAVPGESKKNRYDHLLEEVLAAVGRVDAGVASAGERFAKRMHPC